MDVKPRVLIIDDEPLIRMSLADTLFSRGYTVLTAEEGNQGMELLKKESFDIIITDIKLPNGDGFQILNAAKELLPDAAVIMMTAYAEVKSAVKAMKEGAFDYLTKPFSMDELTLLVERFLKYRRLEAENIRLKQEVTEKEGFHSLIGRSPAMEKVFELIETVAPTDSSILIYGDTGVGKELVANAIHDLSPRKDKPFIKINCASIPENLLESELFGHEKGAFTGAISKRKGKFEFANGGTILFDEIGEMPINTQPKLLRVLETKGFERVGGNETIETDVRMIFATKENLDEAVREGRFRDDLYYRINVIPISIPPLKERREDIPLLIEHFLKSYCIKKNKPDLRFSANAFSRLLEYDYPGNVRELKHAIEMAVTLCRDSEIEIEIENLPLPISAFRGPSPDKPSPILKGKPLTDYLKELEREKIQYTLRMAGGKKKEAAKLLGITRKSLWQKIKNLNISS